MLDSIGHLASDGMSDHELRSLLYALVTRFKALGVTTMLTLEAAELHGADRVTERMFSPVADNLLVLRYERQRSTLRPTLTVVKTRGSAHDLGIHPITIGRGGLRIGQAVEARRAKPPTRKPAKR